GYFKNFSHPQAAGYNTEVISGMDTLMIHFDGWPALMKKDVGSGELVWFNARTRHSSMNGTDYQWYRTLTRNVLNHFFGTPVDTPRTLMLDLSQLGDRTSNTTVLHSLLKSGYTVTYNRSSVLYAGEFDLSNFDLVVIAMDGGYPEAFINETLAPWVRAGGKFLLVGATNYQPFEAVMNESFVEIDRYSWKYQYNFTVDLPSPLTEGIPNFYIWGDPKGSYGCVEIVTPSVIPISAGIDGHFATHNRIGNGEFLWLTNSPFDDYFKNETDRSIENRLIENALKIITQPTKKMLFDESHQTTVDHILNVTTANGYNDFWGIANLTGWEVDRLIGNPGTNNITSVILANYDALVLCGPQSNYSASEILAIENFAANGGAVLLLFEGSLISNLNETFSGFDIAFHTSAAGSGSTTDMKEHPITNGVTIIDPYVCGDSIIPDGVNTLYLINGSSGPCFASVSVNRRFVAIADTDIFDVDSNGLANLDNSLFAYNVINWLSQIERGSPIQLNLPTDDYKTKESVTVWWTWVADSQCRSWVKLDNGPWLLKENQSVHTFYDLSEGNHTVFVRQENWGLDNKTISKQFTIDQTGPVISITAPIGLVNSTNNITVTWTTNDTDVDHFYIKLNTTSAEEFITNATSYTYNNLTNGYYEVTVFGVDDLGTNGTEATMVFQVNYVPGNNPLDLLGDPMLLLMIGGVAGIIIIIVIIVIYTKKKKPTIKKATKKK
ncbi:MAG: hypothetical protein ACTSUV_03445, partial [Candidatus Ranarchaeia archaeon]